MTNDAPISLMQRFKLAIDEAFRHAMNVHSGHLFYTKTIGLAKLFTGSLPFGLLEEEISEEVLTFIRSYGGIVSVNQNGHTQAALWEFLPDEFREFQALVQEKLSDAQVTAPIEIDSFIHSPEYFLIGKKTSESHSQSHQWYRWLEHHLKHTRKEMVQLAIRTLEDGDAVFYAVCLSDAEEFREQKFDSTKSLVNRLRLESVRLEKAYTEIQLSTLIELSELCEPRVLNSDQVEKIRKLFLPVVMASDAPPLRKATLKELLPSLERRYALLDEVPRIWFPKLEKVSTALRIDFEEGGLTEDKTQILEIGWEMFRTLILPKVLEMKVWIPHGKVKNFTAITTASKADGIPILTWDHERLRNPLSFYTFGGGALAKYWNCDAESFEEVSGISLPPWLMTPFKSPLHVNKNVVVYLRQARPIHEANFCFFSDLIAPQFSHLSKDIVEYSKTQRMTNKADASACGLIMLGKFSDPLLNASIVKVLMKDRCQLFQLTND